MLKKISSLAGAKKLSKKEQVEISGGMIPITCNSDSDCVIPGAPFCISACGDVGGGRKLCIYDNLTCFGGIGG